MRRNWFTSGLWNVVCDRCASKLKNTEVQLEPRTGLMVCSKCWESWHPQEIIRPVPEQQKLPFTRPEPTDVYITGICTGLTRQGLAGYGGADCAMVGLDLGQRDPYEPSFADS